MKRRKIGFYLPGSLDIDMVIKKHPLPIGLKKEILIVFLDLINSVPAGNKDFKHKSGGFTPLCSKSLRSLNYRYYDYIDYALSTKILECDNDYYFTGTSPGRCHGYKFAKEYQSAGLKCQAISPPRKIAYSKLGHPKHALTYKHLYQWFDGLQIDWKSASTWIDQSYSSPEECNKINSHKIAVDRIARKEFFFKIDDQAGRLHTNLSNLKSELRAFTTYNGTPLVNVDIKTSQPFLIGAIFEVFHDFYKNSSALNRNNYSFSIYPPSLPQSIIQYLPPPLILQKYGKEVKNEDVRHFINLVGESNQFYEFFQQLLKSEHGLVYVSRAEFKKHCIFPILYSSNRFIGQQAALPKRLFRNTFPTVYRFICEVKKNNKERFPLLMQSLEAHLVLNLITRKASKKYPKVPIFTIHDSVVTTVGNEEKIKNIMEDTIASFAGFAPAFKYEFWCPEIVNV